ncbi:MAG: hypothetical protein U0835_24780 [Isosphaeraceae bacterium]
MRKRWGALTILGALSVGLGLGARPAAAGGAGCPTCAHAAAANLIPMGHGHEKLPVWEDESPLYPQLAWWTFERSQCKQGHPFKGGGIHQRSAYAANEPVSFPPLPYSPLAGRVYPQNPSGMMPPHGVAPAPAAGPAPAPPPPPRAPRDRFA